MSESALSDFDYLVASMTEIGVPREKAEAAARRELGIQPPSEMQMLRDQALVAQLEDDIVDDGDRIMLALGFAVIRLSQKRRSKITEGVPDRRYYHSGRKLFLWWEAKAAWGRQSNPQREFQMLCDATEDPYVLGGLDQLRAWLVDHQVATFDERGLPYPTPLAHA